MFNYKKRQLHISFLYMKLFYLSSDNNFNLLLIFDYQRIDIVIIIFVSIQFGLRQLDLSLLSQLWSLNESIQEFRQLLQEQEDRAPSPSPSSEEGDDTSYGTHPPPPPRRPAPTLHHHRPPRPPRPPRPSASDESPSSEEYGAV